MVGERIVITLIATLGLTVSAFLVGGRYEVYPQGKDIWRLDRYTGTLSICGLTDEGIECLTVVEGGVAANNTLSDAEVDDTP